MSGTPAACHSVFKLLITGAVISVFRLLRGFMMYFSGPAPVCWQNWTPGTLLLKQASLITSCALYLGKLGFWSAAIPEFLDQSKKQTGGNVALIISSCLLKSVLWCRRNTQEDPFQTWAGLRRLRRLEIITDSESTCIARAVSTRASIATQMQFDVACKRSCRGLLKVGLRWMCSCW